MSESSYKVYKKLLESYEKGDYSHFVESIEMYSTKMEFLDCLQNDSDIDVHTKYKICETLYIKSWTV